MSDYLDQRIVSRAFDGKLIVRVLDGGHDELTFEFSDGTSVRLIVQNGQLALELRL